MEKIDLKSKINLKWLIILEIFLLAILYVIGMYVNLYVSYLSFNGSSAAFSAHMAMGIITGLFAIIILLLTIREKNWDATYFAVISLVFIFIGGISGIAFVNGGQDPYESFSMSVSFIIAILAQFLIIFMGNKHKTGNTSSA